MVIKVLICLGIIFENNLNRVVKFCILYKINIIVVKLWEDFFI